MFKSVRTFSSASRLSTRSKPLAFSNLADIKLRAPIAPTHKNFDVSPDHPLWAFFEGGNTSKAALRDGNDITQLEVRPWSMAELRRKSFVDLHQIWYQVLKERNIIGTELRLAESLEYSRAHHHKDFDEKLALVQKRIKVVLLERQTAYERAQLLDDVKQEYLEQFKQRYIEVDQANEVDMEEKLDRLQFAVFGIQPDLNDIDLEHDINVSFIKGVEYNAELKWGKHLQETGQNLAPLKSIVEQLPFLLKDTTEAVEEVIELRDSEVDVKMDKIDVIPFLKSAIGNFRGDGIEEEVAEDI
ncbi:54S ribosomal protein L4, mitochondrial [[Candida] railenensis]|uniref:Large ribosomal subunit protein uL29m n=1 Tax=[Candida] railenensis TaxID=45579 RepID=A0A9P0QRK8_9ASCO|nr:54S ribosomal protein L4, mitochondrial [[Candida] railenensis]